LILLTNTKIILRIGIIIVAAIRENIMESAVAAIIGTLLGTWLGYRLSLAQSERNFRRTVLRSIAFEYRQLANSGTAGDIQGLILAGILQCNSDDEFRQVLDLAENLSPTIPPGKSWRPLNGRFTEFFTRLVSENKDPANSTQMKVLKQEVDAH